MSFLIVLIIIIVAVIVPGIYLERLEKKKGQALEENEGGCFIAASVYGKSVHPDLKILRNFRDNILKKYWLGKRFVIWYYNFSPIIAKWIAESELGKFLVRNLLVKPAVIFLKTFL